MNREERRKRASKTRNFRRVMLVIFVLIILVGGFFLVKSVAGIIKNSSKAEKESAEETTADSEEETEPDTQEDTEPITESNSESESETESEPDTEEENVTALSVNPDNLYSHSIYMLKEEDGQILMSLNADEVVYPASLTKIMMVLIAIEKVEDLEEGITITQELLDDLLAQDASVAGFQAGETVRIIDLLYGAMMASGAECCLSVAEYLAGSEEAFVVWMNEKAEELGLANTHYTNCTGLHDEEHYSTAKDIMVLLQYALENETFYEIFTTNVYQTGTIEGRGETATLYSTLDQKTDTMEVTGGEILGGKTGYTSDAGLCLASVAEVDGVKYILINLGAEGDPYSEQTNITDAFTLYNAIER